MDNELKNEFMSLYLDWKNSWIYSAEGIEFNEKYNKLYEWCCEHKEDSIKFIYELIENNPDESVLLLPSLLDTKVVYIKSRQHSHPIMEISELCNYFLNLKNGTKGKDYYKDFREWKRHLAEKYISWNPFKENDPNVTLEEFKKGKRNK